jgi:uncharacterized membrane protein
MKEKIISKKSYIWGHVATILFHIIIACVLISVYFMKSWSRKKVDIICVSLGSILLTVSLLSFIPILTNWEKIMIE